MSSSLPHRSAMESSRPLKNERLTRVRAQPQASTSVSHVCIVFHVTARALLLAQVCKHRLASVLPTPLIALARIRAITSLSIAAVGNCLVVLQVGHAPQPVRVSCYPVPVVPKAHHVLSQESVVAGRAVCGEPSASQNQCSEAASKGAFLFNLAVGFLVGVCSCLTLCCALEMEAGLLDSEV